MLAGWSADFYGEIVGDMLTELGENVPKLAKGGVRLPSKMFASKAGRAGLMPVSAQAPIFDMAKSEKGVFNVVSYSGSIVKSMSDLSVNALVPVSKGRKGGGLMPVSVYKGGVLKSVWDGIPVSVPPIANIPPSIPPDIPSEVPPSEVPPNIPPNVPPNVPPDSMANILSNVPVLTPGNFPSIGFIDYGGTKAGVRVGKKTYLNEVLAAQSLLMAEMGFKGLPKKILRQKPKHSAKKKGFKSISVMGNTKNVYKNLFKDINNFNKRINKII
jgi:hypothetical protein